MQPFNFYLYSLQRPNSIPSENGIIAQYYRCWCDLMQ